MTETPEATITRLTAELASERGYRARLLNVCEGLHEKAKADEANDRVSVRLAWTFLIVATLAVIVRAVWSVWG